jgi:Domain of unknown function (DUF4129)
VTTVDAAQAVDPDAARRVAQHILSDRRFRPSPAPRPLRGPLQWLGDRINGSFSTPQATWTFVAVIVLVVAFVVWVVVRAVRRRRALAPVRKPTAGAPDETENPDELERAADAAERDGDLDRAVRLRFRAGLLRLGDRGAIRYRLSVTTGEVRRTLDSRRFDDLARTFEAVTYGGRSADPPDVKAARQDWPRVLEEAGRR